jgi:hypothetical protein
MGAAPAPDTVLLRVAKPQYPACVFAPGPKVRVLLASARPPRCSTSQAIRAYLKPLREGGAAGVQVVATTDFVRGVAVAPLAALRLFLTAFSSSEANAEKACKWRPRPRPPA